MKEDEVIDLLVNDVEEYIRGYLRCNRKIDTKSDTKLRIILEEVAGE